MRLACILLAAAGPVYGADEDLYPIEKGNSWEFTDGWTTYTYVVEERSGKDAVLTARENGQLASRTLIRIEKDGIYEIGIENGSGAAKHAKPVLVIRFPVKVGDSWKGLLTISRHRYETETKVLGEEKVELRDGAKNAVVIVTTGETYGSSVTLKTWYVRGIGPVKSLLIASTGGQQMTFEYQLVKANVKPVKKRPVPQARKCGKCGSVVAKDDKVCGECGTELTPQKSERCGKCGAKLEAKEKHCGECGEPRRKDE